MCANVPDERLKVTVKNGWVTLEGEVDCYYQNGGRNRREIPARGQGRHEQDQGEAVTRTEGPQTKDREGVENGTLKVDA